MSERLTILQGDAIERLRELPTESVHCCVTSPPYWGLRDYSTNGQLGLEKTPEEYVAKMVEIFREVRRVLRRDGTLWLNLGDSYASSGGEREYGSSDGATGRGNGTRRHDVPATGLKPKDLCGIPWRVAFALQADGWWLRSDIIWAKPNPMPESVTDRPTKAHEYLFLLTKSANYFYDAEAIKEGVTGNAHAQGNGIGRKFDEPGSGNRANWDAKSAMHNATWADLPTSRNKRSVWTVATAPYPEAHFATYPPDLIKPCIMAGTSAKGCCAKCGAPWERIVERQANPNGITGGEHREIGRDGGLGKRERDLEFERQIGRCETLGWRQACDCKFGIGHYPITPCTVLDPFAGSGTTGAVAIELGRRTVLIELNPKYVHLIRDRCNITPGLALA